MSKRSPRARAAARERAAAPAWTAWAVPAAACALFLFFFAQGARRPPLFGLPFATTARNWIVAAGALLTGRPASFQNPFLAEAIHGPGPILWLLPFVAALGLSPAAVALSNAVSGLAAVWLTYALALELYGDRAAAGLAAALTACAGSFAVLLLAGAYIGAVSIALGLGACRALLAYEKTRNPRAAVLAGGLLGAALLTHSSQAALLAGVGAWVIYAREDLRRAAPAGVPAELVAWRAAACLGALALPLAWQTFSRGPVQSDLLMYARVALGGRNNFADYPQDLLVRATQFAGLFTASEGWRFVSRLPPPEPRASWPLWAVLAAAAAAAARARRAGRPRRLLLPWIAAGAYLALSPLSPHFLSEYHLMTLMPLGAICAAALVGAAAGRARAAGAAALAALCLWCAFGAERAMARIYAEQRDDGRSVARLCAYLRAGAVADVLFGLQPGAARFYAGTEVGLIDGENDEASALQVLSVVGPVPRPLVAVREPASSDSWRRFRARAERAGLRFRRAASFPRSDGSDDFVVFAATDRFVDRRVGAKLQ